MRLSVIIPTLNERGLLEAAIGRLRAGAGNGGVEIIVADGGSRDGTPEVARRAADLLVASPAGRAVQMHAGALAATGELLLFLHADTRLPDGWSSALSRAWTSRPAPGATAFRLGFASAGRVYRLLAVLAEWRYRRTGVPHGDQAIACRREDYLRVGGFPPVPLLEEYFLLPKLSSLGPIVILDEAVATATRRHEKNGPIRNALRNNALIALFKLGVSPRRLARFYR